MENLEKNTNKIEEDFIEKVNEDFFDTIKHALHIAHGFFFDLTEDEIREIKNIQKEAYKNLKGETEFNLYPLCIAELYKTVLNDSYNHMIAKSKEPFQNFENNYGIDVKDTNVDEFEKEEFNKEVNADLDKKEISFENIVNTSLQKNTQEDLLEDKIAENIDSCKDTDESSKKLSLDQQENISEVIQEEPKTFKMKDSEENEIVKPNPFEDILDELEENKPLDEVASGNFKKKGIISEPIVEESNTEIFLDNDEEIEKSLSDDGIEIDDTVEEDPLHFTNFKFFTDRTIEE